MTTSPNEQPPLRRSKQHHKNNFLIHQLYVRQVCAASLAKLTLLMARYILVEVQDLEDCLTLIESTLAETQETAEYAIYIKALIHRQQGAFASLACTDM